MTLSNSNLAVKVAVLFKGEYYLNQCILYCPTADINLLNVQYNVLLMSGPSAIAESPVNPLKPTVAIWVQL